MSTHMQSLYTPEQIATALRVKPATIHRWLRLGTLQGVRIGRLWRITHKQLEDFTGLELPFMDIRDREVK